MEVTRRSIDGRAFEVVEQVDVNASILGKIVPNGGGILEAGIDELKTRRRVRNGLAG